jgi:alanine racemase
MGAGIRWAWAEVDLDAIAHNVAVLRRAAAPAAVWAVVKADGYGHGAVPVAQAALGAGCEGLCIALTSEGVALRQAGIDAPILLLSEQPPGDAGLIADHRLTPTVSTTDGIDGLAAQRVRDLDVHLKIDTGMHRVGAAPADAALLVERIDSHRPWLRLAGVFTHLAVADEPADPYTDQQLDRFDEALGTIPPGPATHAANSAAALSHERARRSFVRAGIAVYGISPGPGVDHLCGDLRPAMALKAKVSFVKRVAAGARISYGLRHTFGAETTVATLPIGYADGVRRGLSNNGSVLIGGRRRPIVGVVTMDQLMVDCGDDQVRAGDEAVLIGAQGDERITAEEWGDALGTIGYEVVCGIGARVPRWYLGRTDVTSGPGCPPG